MKAIKHTIYSIINGKAVLGKYDYIDICVILKLENEVEFKIPVLIVPVMRSMGVLS